MDKTAKVLKEIKRLYVEYISFPDERGIKTLQQYASEVSRERALEFEMHKQKMVSGRQKDLHIYNFLADYDEWQQKQ